jgi:short-subunit dehydrogenase
MSFENSRIAIIGAAGGVGTALSRTLWTHGAVLFLLGQSAEKFATRGTELDAQTFPADASKVSDLEQVIAGIGSVTGIVNCAGSILLNRRTSPRRRNGCKRSEPI